MPILNYYYLLSLPVLTNMSRGEQNESHTLATIFCPVAAIRSSFAAFKKGTLFLACWLILSSITPQKKSGRGFQLDENGWQKSSDQLWGTFLSNHAWVVLVLYAEVESFWKREGRSAILFIHDFRMFLKISWYISAVVFRLLWRNNKFMTGHLLGMTRRTMVGKGKLGVPYDGPLCDIFADPSVVLPVSLLVLVEVLSFRENPEHPSGSVLELVEWCCCLDTSQLLKCLPDKHAMRPAVGEMTNKTCLIVQPVVTSSTCGSLRHLRCWRSSGLHLRWWST